MEHKAEVESIDKLFIQLDQEQRELEADLLTITNIEGNK